MNFWPKQTNFLQKFSEKTDDFSRETFLKHRQSFKSFETIYMTVLHFFDLRRFFCELLANENNFFFQKISGWNIFETFWNITMFQVFWDNFHDSFAFHWSKKVLLWIPGQREQFFFKQKSVVETVLWGAINGAHGATIQKLLTNIKHSKVLVYFSNFQTLGAGCYQWCPWRHDPTKTSMGASNYKII